MKSQIIPNIHLFTSRSVPYGKTVRIAPAVRLWIIKIALGLEIGAILEKTNKMRRFFGSFDCFSETGRSEMNKADVIITSAL